MSCCPALPFWRGEHAERLNDCLSGSISTEGGIVKERDERDEMERVRESKTGERDRKRERKIERETERGVLPEWRDSRGSFAQVN